MSIAEIVLSEDLASRVESAARVRGVTAAMFIAESVDMRLAVERQMARLEERAARSNVQSAIELVRNAPDVAPEDIDGMSDDTCVEGMGR